MFGKFAAHRIGTKVASFGGRKLTIPDNAFPFEGKWIVRWKDMNSQTEAEEHFDGVLLCTGMRQKGWRPAKWRMEMEFKVMEKKGGIWRNNEYLKGKVLHAEDFTNAADYRDQTVCVVGMGNSAVEIAAALAPVAKQVTK
jgi:cation diffusion facilitator CzcD-associated flavoprotein CzcO